jgi:hypothetical protein
MVLDKVALEQLGGGIRAALSPTIVRQRENGVTVGWALKSKPPIL